MCGFYYIAFREYVLARKTLLDYTNIFSPNHCTNNDKIIYMSFKEKMEEEAGLEFRLRKNDETKY